MGRTPLLSEPSETVRPVQPLINGLGDRERSVSADATEAVSVPVPDGWRSSERGTVPHSPLVDMATAPLVPNRTTTETIIAANLTASPLLLFSSGQVSRPRNPHFRAAVDPETLLCDEPLSIPEPVYIPLDLTSDSSQPRTSYNDRPNDNLHHTEALSMLRESASVISLLDERLQNLRTRGAPDEELTGILRELENMAEGLGRWERGLRNSLRSMRRARENPLEGSWENGVDALHARINAQFEEVVGDDSEVERISARASERDTERARGPATTSATPLGLNITQAWRATHRDELSRDHHPEPQRFTSENYQMRLREAMEQQRREAESGTGRELGRL